MIRQYSIKWYENKTAKYNKEPLYRTNIISFNNATGVTSIDSKRALNTFILGFGNLTKNTIVCIKELDEKGNQIGEDIIPSEEETIVPIMK